LVASFIILTTATTVRVSGSANEIKTAADAAKALEPLAGHYAFLVFAAGIVGTGMLAIPVLAGSAAYAVSELFKWRASLESKPSRARKFYYVISAATILGLGLNLAGFNPIRDSFLSALLNGLVAVPFMFLLMLISMNPAIVGKFLLHFYLSLLDRLASC